MPVLRRKQPSAASMSRFHCTAVMDGLKAVPFKEAVVGVFETGIG
jgi:hypothetical protein